MTTILAAVAEYLSECGDGERHEGWMRVTDQRVGKGRWLEQHWLVVTNGEGFYGIPFAVGLTESQEHEYPWAPSWGETPTDLILTPLVSVEITTTKYLTEKQYAKHLGKAGSDG